MRNDQAIKFKNLKRGQFLHSNFLYTDYTLDYTLASLERIGAKKLEFYGAEPHLCFYDLTYGDMAGFKRKLDRHGLSIVEINPECCTYPNNLASKDPVTRLRSFRYFENVIHTAGVIGAATVVMCPGSARKDEDPEEAWKLAADSMSRLADIAETEGITIVMEATTRNYTVTTDHRRMKRFLDACGKDNLGVVVDLMCLAQTGETAQDAYDACGKDKIRSVHYRDGALLETGSWANRVPGERTLSLDADLQVFDEQEYQGYFGSEIRWSTDPDLNTPELVCKKIQDWIDLHF